MYRFVEEVLIMRTIIISAIDTLSEALQCIRLSLIGLSQRVRMLKLCRSQGVTLSKQQRRPSGDIGELTRGVTVRTFKATTLLFMGSSMFDTYPMTCGLRSLTHISTTGNLAYSAISSTSVCCSIAHSQTRYSCDRQGGSTITIAMRQSQRSVP